MTTLSISSRPSKWSPIIRNKSGWASQEREKQGKEESEKRDRIFERWVQIDTINSLGQVKEQTRISAWGYVFVLCCSVVIQ